MLSFSNLEIYTQACQNSPAGVWGAIAPVGIQTNMPAKPLHILGLLQCPDPAIRLEYQPYIGHLALQTPGNPFYSTISTPGDMILQADFYAGDILLTTRNNTSSIRFATTPPLSMVDNERMTIIPDGNVGINNNNPVSKFQVTDGSVLFNGTTGSTPVTDAGTRFMWIPEKAALRAGYVDGTQWNTIGNYSVALGKNNEASNNLGFAVGDANITGGHWPGMALGFRNRTFDAGEGYEGDESIAIGSDCNAYGWASIAMGKEATVTYATELGFAFGFEIETGGQQSTTMGNFVKTGHYDLGSFMIGCYNQDNSVGWPHWTPADNDNEIVLRFNDDDTTTYSFRLITGIANNQQIGIDAMHMGTWWISNSDSTLKKNIQSVNEYDILSRIRNIPVKYWQWKDGYAFEGKELVWQEHHQTLMGPMAQDFTREFPIGVPDNKHLNTAIIDAVTIASIQSLANITDTIKAAVSQQQAKTAELDEKTDELLTKTEFQKFKDTLYCYADACKRIEELEGIMQDLYNRIEELEDKLNDINEEKENPDNSPQGINEKSKFDDIMLMQNNPNPFAETTEINYYIPSKYSGQAKLIIADEKGTYRYQEFEACFGKPCQIKVSAKELNTGVYLYGILINGRLVKSQKMMIIK